MASSGGGGIQFDPAELEQEPYDPGKGYYHSKLFEFSPFTVVSYKNESFLLTAILPPVLVLKIGMPV